MSVINTNVKSLVAQNAATVNNVEVIQALTSTNLRTAPGSGVI